MKLCIYTNFGALFSTVDVDFGFFAHIKIFEIAKFVYWTKLTSFLPGCNKPVKLTTCNKPDVFGCV